MFAVRQESCKHVAAQFLSEHLVHRYSPFFKHHSINFSSLILGDARKMTGFCGQMLIVLSWILVVITLPFSLFFCLKVLHKWSEEGKTCFHTGTSFLDCTRIWTRSHFPPRTPYLWRCKRTWLDKLISFLFEAAYEFAFFIGLFFILPCIDTYRKIDLRTVSFDVPPQEVS